MARGVNRATTRVKLGPVWAPRSTSCERRRDWTKERDAPCVSEILPRNGGGTSGCSLEEVEEGHRRRRLGTSETTEVLGGEEGRGGVALRNSGIRGGGRGQL